MLLEDDNLSLIEGLQAQSIGLWNRDHFTFIDFDQKGGISENINNSKPSLQNLLNVSVFEFIHQTSQPHELILSTEIAKKNELFLQM